MNGDCLEKLRTLESGTVNCCVTSPPYYGLRDYGTADWEGGDAGCEHFICGDGESAGEKQKTNQGSLRTAKETCPHCGAVRIDRQIGLEKTPDEYVAKLVEIFREVRRVLRNDGTLWLNIGDSYAGSNCGSNDYRETTGLRAAPTQKYKGQRPGEISGCKPKDLIGIPWMLAFALRADGWWLRQDIIWAKPNPMPESVKDRCTKSHEYIFLLSKSANYYYNAEAIREPHTDKNVVDGVYTGNGGVSSDSWIPKTQAWNGSGLKMENRMYNPDGRNKHSVWTITTQPFKEAHFATFPPELPRLCILAGCPPGGTVLDPFAGSGTVGMVAEGYGRDSLLIELNGEYVKMMKRRTAQQGMGI